MGVVGICVSRETWNVGFSYPLAFDGANNSPFLLCSMFLCHTRIQRPTGVVKYIGYSDMGDGFKTAGWRLEVLPTGKLTLMPQRSDVPTSHCYETLCLPIRSTPCAANEERSGPSDGGSRPQPNPDAGDADCEVDFFLILACHGAVRRGRQPVQRRRRQRGRQVFGLVDFVYNIDTAFPWLRSW
jgi:hypothetical protein